MYLILRVFLLSASGSSLASTNMLAVGEVRNAPIAILTAAWWTVSSERLLEAHAESYTIHP